MTTAGFVTCRNEKKRVNVLRLKLEENSEDNTKFSIRFGSKSCSDFEMLCYIQIGPEHFTALQVMDRCVGPTMNLHQKASKSLLQHTLPAL